MNKLIEPILTGARRAAFAAILCSCARQGLASDYQYYFDNVLSYSGVSAPAAPAPWLDVMVQGVSPGRVQVTVQNLGLSSGEFVSTLYLNLNTAYNPDSLVFNAIASNGSFDYPTITGRADAYRAGGHGLHDIQFAFSTANNALQRFDRNDSVTYLVTGIPTLAADDFRFYNVPAGGKGAYYASAHIQGITVPTCGSVWAGPAGALPAPPIPEPAATALLALSALLWGRRPPVLRVLRE